MLADLESAPIDDKLKAMLRYLRKVTLTPDEVVAEDARALKQAGISRSAAEDALLVAYCFNMIARVADALGWHIPEEGFGASVKVLLEQGYLMPFHKIDRSWLGKHG